MIRSFTFKTPQASAPLLQRLKQAGLMTGEDGNLIQLYDEPNEFFEGESRVLLKFIDGEIVGVLHVARAAFLAPVIQAKFSEDCYGCIQMYTLEAYRHQGVATSLLERLYRTYAHDTFVMTSVLHQLVAPRYGDRARDCELVVFPWRTPRRLGMFDPVQREPVARIVFV